MRPFWLERQHDVTGPDFVPTPEGTEPINLTHRSWAMVGTVATPDRGIVDPRGLVTPAAPGEGRGWSLDWWIGADDRWHAPSREVAVRQRLVGDAPVVETLVRIPGGDAVQRVYAVHASTDSPFGQAFVVVEIENASAVPFALALAVRPYNPLGRAPVHSIDLDPPTLAAGAGRDGGERRVLVNGQPGLVLPRPPARALTAVAASAGEGTSDAGDVADGVFAGRAEEEFVAVRCERGRAEAAFVYPLPHTAVLRVVLPLGGGAPTRRRASAPGFPGALPSAEQVAKGWESQARRGLRVTLPDPAWEAALTAGRRWLLVAHGGEDLATWPPRPLDWEAAEAVLGALGEQGFHEEAAQVLATVPERQALDGSLVGPAGSPAANGAALAALSRHAALTGDTELAQELVGPMAKAVHWIDKRRRSRRATPFTTAERATTVAGLGAASELLDRIGQPEVADAARAAAAALAAEQGDQPPPGGIDEAGAAVIDPVAGAGFSPTHTARRARAEVEAGDPVALDRLAWLLGAAAPTGTWPQVVHPRTGDGSAGDGHDPVAGAEVLRLLRAVLVRETADGLALCSLLPPSWRGQGFEVHEAPTAWGRLSFAVRWHGARPALLWELDPHPDLVPAVLTAPGIDPAWRTTDTRGDALLAAPAAPSGEQLAAQPAHRQAADQGERPSIGEEGQEPGASFT